ncbi:MAG TPA: methylcobamide:CoM methyltransferase MtaA [Candidatus Methanofastidiosa archaeon]|nr:methylcobamide:CoM methyltransferase MtaA [Candidatus Methanofastidiosa archaeon]
MTPKKRLKNAIYGKDVDIIPVVSVTQTGTKDLMDICGAYWPDAQKDPVKMANLAYEAYNTIGFEAVRVPYCLTVLMEALGCDIMEGGTTRQPSIASHPYNSRQPLPLKPIPEDVLEQKRIPVVLDAIGELRSKVGDDVPIISGAEGPVTVASDLLEVTTFMKWTIKKMDAVKEYLEYATDAVISYANAMFDAGADVFSLLDPVASPELMNPRDFNDMVLPLYQKMSGELKGDVVLHICGNVEFILPYLKDTGFAAVSIEEKTDLVKAKEIFDGDIRVVGNVSTSTTLFNGTPDEVYKEAREAIDNGTDVLAPGCGLAPMTPLENCRALVRARNEFYI